MKSDERLKRSDFGKNCRSSRARLQPLKVCHEQTSVDNLAVGKGAKRSAPPLKLPSHSKLAFTNSGICSWEVQYCG